MKNNLTEITTSLEFHSFVKEIKNRILKSQYEALKKVNKELIGLYWSIGEDIVKKQNEYGWGKSIVKNLSQELQKEFVGIKGFSVQNLWNMRQFYLEYYQDRKLQPLVGEISWTKNVVIFQKVKDVLAREFYIKSVMKFGWTKDLLINHLESNSYEKFLLNQTNFDKSLPSEVYLQQAKLSVKDEYNFSFLELGDEYSEHQLEIALINNVRNFLAEMGSDFTFVGNQYKLEIDDEEYFIDLLLYHRRLKSLIAIELKIGKFKPEYAGKMSFYLSILNDTVKLKDENQSIGIIICKEKNRTIVEYSLKENMQPMGVSTYQTSKVLPKNLEQYLPNTEEIEKSLMNFLEDKYEK